MGFLSSLFSSPAPEKYLEEGDRLNGQGRYFEARQAYDKGLAGCRVRGDADDRTARVLSERISDANRSLALLNIEEASAAAVRGNSDKAFEHLELAKSLTDDLVVREKADYQIRQLAEIANDPEVLQSVSSCSSCAGSMSGSEGDADADRGDMPPLEYYDLLIHQLPSEMYERYVNLGEEFAYAYIAEADGEHEKALKLLETVPDLGCRDILLYEKGMILYRTGQVEVAEKYIREACSLAPLNSLARLGLSLLLMEQERFDEAASQLDTMIAEAMLLNQSLVLRGDVWAHSGAYDQAIAAYARLLDTPAMKTGAERLHDLFLHTGRPVDAEQIRKRYLAGCKH